MIPSNSFFTIVTEGFKANYIGTLLACKETGICVQRIQLRPKRREFASKEFGILARRNRNFLPNKFGICIQKNENLLPKNLELASKKMRICFHTQQKWCTYDQVLHHLGTMHMSCFQRYIFCFWIIMILFSYIEELLPYVHRFVSSKKEKT